MSRNQVSALFIDACQEANEIRGDELEELDKLLRDDELFIDSCQEEFEGRDFGAEQFEAEERELAAFESRFGFGERVG